MFEYAAVVTRNLSSFHSRNWVFRALRLAEIHLKF